VKEHGDRCRAKAFQIWRSVVPSRVKGIVGVVAHVYVYDAGLLEDCFPDEETDFEWKVVEQFEK
jgi:hypothetical protein